jgi:DNA-binding NarL/FixJ family response regulator
LNKPRVVVADDDSRILSAVSKLLNPQFEVVACVFDGQEAIEAVLRLQPDVVVLDILMPVLDGVQAARRILKLVSTAKIIFLTGIEDPEYVTAAFELGGRGFVYKPSLYTDLPLAIAAVLEGRTFCSEKRRGTEAQG